MKYIINFLKASAVIAVALFVAIPSVHAAAEINEVGNQTMCKNIAVVAMAGDPWGPDQSITASPGDLVSIRGMASNTGNSGANMTYRITPTGGTSSTHHFNIQISGGGYSDADSVTVDLTEDATMTLEKVYKVSRSGAYSFSSPVLQSLSAVKTTYLPAANFGSANEDYECDSYANFTAPHGPVVENYEQGFIWQYRVGPGNDNGGNDYNPQATLGGPSTATAGQSVTLTWDVTDMELYSCDIPAAGGNNINNTSDDAGVRPVTIPSNVSSITYTLICTGLDGSQYSDTHTISVNGGGGTGNGTLNITTDSATNIDSDSAQLNGTMTNDGTGNVDIWFIISTDQTDVNTIGDCSNTGIDITAMNNANGNGIDFDVVDSGLNDNTTYYFAACARDSANNIDFGGVRSFTTDDGGSNTANFDVNTLSISSSDYDSDSAEFSGEVLNANDVDTWFVYSDSDSSPECGDENGSTDDEFVSVSGLFDDNDTFTKTVTGLNDNTTYYFRACGEKNGDYATGSVKSFETDSDSNGGGNNDPTRNDVGGSGAPIVTTMLPSAVGGTTANLLAQINANGCDTESWFEYTTIPGSFGQQTNSLDFGNSYGSFRQTANDLLPGITYYVRAVAQNCVDTSRGNTISFRTVGATGTGGANNTNTNTTVVQYVNGGNGSDWLRLDINDNTDTAAVGQVLQYKVEWENLTTSTLNDGKISVVFPREIRLLSTTEGQIIASDNSIMVDLGDIKGREKGDFTVTTRVRSIAVGTRIVAQAIAAFDTPKSDAQVNAIDYDEDQITSGGLLGAAAFGAGPFGLGLIGWLLLLLIIALIYLIARYAAMARTRTAYPTYAPYAPHNPYYNQVPQQPMYAPQPIYVQQPPMAAPAPAPVMMQSAPVQSAPAELPVEAPAAPAEPEYVYKPYKPVRPE